MGKVTSILDYLSRRPRTLRLDARGNASHDLTWPKRVRYWLIKLIAGQSVIVVNADIDTVPMQYKNGVPIMLEVTDCVHGSLVSSCRLREQHNGRVLRIRPMHID